MYKMIVKIALASLFRRRSRTFSVVLMISVSLWGLLFMEGLYEGMMEQMIRNAIRSDCGEISIFAKGYRQEKDIKNLITKPGEVEEYLRSDLEVRSYVKRLEHQGLAATAHYSRGVSFLAIESKAEQRQGRLQEYMVAGDFTFGSNGKGLILGAELAEKLKVEMGRKVIVSAQATDDEIASMALKVSGIIRTNNMALDDGAVFVDLTTFSRLLQVGGAVSRFALFSENPENLETVQARLRARFPDLEVFRWDELYPALMQSRVMMKWFNLVTAFLVFSAAAIGIIGVMLVSVLERIREFGIMTAVGTEFRQIAGVVLVESLLIGLAGYIGGSLLGWATLYHFKVKGLDLTTFSEAFNAFGMDAVTYAIIRPGYFITPFAAILIAAICSALLPLRILYKAKPIKAIGEI